MKARDLVESEYAQGRLVDDPLGIYSVHGAFHSKSGHGYKPHRGSSTQWFCNECFQPATLEHDKDECHLCVDWNGCGRDCTLSALICDQCTTRQSM